MAIARRALDSTAMIAEIDRLADLARSWLGRFPAWPAEDRWMGYDSDTDPLGEGVLPLLALVVTAPDLAGVAPRTGRAGQRLRAHPGRAGPAGLGAPDELRDLRAPQLWLAAGDLVRVALLARPAAVQPAAARRGVGLLHPHPAVGPAGSGRRSMRHSGRRRSSSRPHFGDYPVADFWCRSWLLAPDLAAELSPESNIAHFQRRWRLDGQHVEADDDLLLFVFGAARRRRRSSRCRGTPRCNGSSVDRLRSGGHWSSWSGRIPMRDWAP